MVFPNSNNPSTNFNDTDDDQSRNQTPLMAVSSNRKQRKVCFSFAAYAKNVIEHLKNCQVPVIEGLTDQEFAVTETSFKFKFPPDLRSILQEGLPVGIGFPDWRSSSHQQLQTLINLPISGLCYQISKGKFWFHSWGSKPSNPNEAVNQAKSFLTKAPILVPIYSNCYMPTIPNLAGNPVFFIHGTDFHYSGFDVADFFQREAFVPDKFRPNSDAFWPKPEVYRQKPTANGNGNKKISKNQVVPARKSIGETPSWSSPEKRDPVVRSAGNSPRNGGYSPEKDLRFTIPAPAWAAKAARRIEFWSDLVEWSTCEAKEQHGDCEVTHTITNNAFKCSIRGPLSEDGHELPNKSCTVTASPCGVPAGVMDGTCDFKGTWVEGFLVGIERTLRKGGWRDGEVREMMSEGKAVGLRDSASLALHLRSMATALGAGSWSAEEVDSFGLDCLGTGCTNTGIEKQI